VDKRPASTPLPTSSTTPTMARTAPRTKGQRSAAGKAARAKTAANKAKLNLVLTPLMAIARRCDALQKQRKDAVDARYAINPAYKATLDQFEVKLDHKNKMWDLQYNNTDEDERGPDRWAVAFTKNLIPYAAVDVVERPVDMARKIVKTPGAGYMTLRRMRGYCYIVHFTAAGPNRTLTLAKIACKSSPAI
jgi:hypothetical protein